MRTGAWFALGFAAGSAATLLAVRLKLAQRYREGRSDGYVARFEDEKPRREAEFQRGRLEGYSDLTRMLARELGAREAGLMLHRMAAMARVDELTGGPCK